MCNCTRANEAITAAVAAMQAHDDTGAAVEQLQSMKNMNSVEKNLIWGDFNRRVSAVVVTLTSSASMEIKQYLKEGYISKMEDPKK